MYESQQAIELTDEISHKLSKLLLFEQFWKFYRNLFEFTYKNT